MNRFRYRYYDDIKLLIDTTCNYFNVLEFITSRGEIYTDDIFEGIMDKNIVDKLNEDPAIRNNVYKIKDDETMFYHPTFYDIVGKSPYAGRYVCPEMFLMAVSKLDANYYIKYSKLIQKVVGFGKISLK